MPIPSTSFEPLNAFKLFNAFKPLHAFNDHLLQNPAQVDASAFQLVNRHLSEEQITTSVLKKLQHPTIKKTSFDRLLCRNPPPFGGSVSLALPYTVHSSPYQNHFIIVQLSVAENPPPLGGSVRLALPYTVQQTIAIIM